VIDREDMEDALSSDRMRLLLDTAREVDTDQIAESVRVATGIRPLVEKVDRLQIFDPDKSLKAKRFIDLR